MIPNKQGKLIVIGPSVPVKQAVHSPILSGMTFDLILGFKCCCSSSQVHLDFSFTDYVDLVFCQCWMFEIQDMFVALGQRDAVSKCVVPQLQIGMRCLQAMTILYKVNMADRTILFPCLSIKSVIVY